MSGVEIDSKFKGQFFAPKYKSVEEINVFTPLIDAKLKLDDLLDIKINLLKARSKWEDIGLSLNIDPETLKCIKSLHRERHDVCLQQVLTHRLQAITPSLTWRVLCECLRCPTVARNDVAVEVEDWIEGQAKCHVSLAIII